MRAVFLDRDGVINRDPGDKKYVTSVKKFEFIPGAKKAIARLYENDFKIFVISNQAGVSKGLYSKKTLDLITEKMLRGIREARGRIEEVYYCTHLPESLCSCRKPKAGLFKKALKGRAINLSRSFFIGDTIRDVRAARAAGCKSILVLSGKEKLRNRGNWEIQPDFIFKNLLLAANFILSVSKKLS